MRGEINVDPVFSKIFMVLQMISLPTRTPQSIKLVLSTPSASFTLNDMAYGTPIGRLAMIASILLAFRPLNARLWVTS